MSEASAPTHVGVWHPRPACSLRLPCGRRLETGPRPLVMGVLNVTPDSFSDGGRFLDAARAAEHGRRLWQEGADIIDVGGESTRPGSEGVDAEQERRRVLPVIERLVDATDVPISIDTQKAEVAAAALDAGAQIINDVSAMRSDPAIGRLAAERGTPLVLMHMQGTPRTMQQSPTYGDVVREVTDWLAARIEAAAAAGVAREQIVADPGFGFGKTLQHNLELLRCLDALHALEAPILVGTSRKSMIGMILDVPPDGRLQGSLATAACAVMKGCHIVRVHDVRATLEIIEVCEAVRQGLSYMPQR